MEARTTYVTVVDGTVIVAGGRVVKSVPVVVEVTVVNGVEVIVKETVGVFSLD